MTRPRHADLAGQTLIIGLPGPTLNQSSARLIKKTRPAGIILFKRNQTLGPQRLSQLISECQELAAGELGRPLLVAIDQEGGTVTRLEAPFTQLPGQRRMGQEMDEDQVFELGQTSGRELAEIGVNMNLAPVLDLARGPESFMFERSFGPDPERAARLGLALIAGHRDQGVACCAKHFPGIGRLRLDPHRLLPWVRETAQEIEAEDLLPFRRVIEAGVDAVMSAHVVYTAWEERLPATLSSRVMTGLLRLRLGFDGLVLSDDLEMGAITRGWGLDRAAVLSLQAGVDINLVCEHEDKIRQCHQAVAEALESGGLTVARLEQTAARLEAVREKYVRAAPAA